MYSHNRLTCFKGVAIKKEQFLSIPLKRLSHQCVCPLYRSRRSFSLKRLDII